LNPIPKSKLAGLINEPALEELAGDRSFARGVGYFRSGAVERLVTRNGRISARVAGTDLYTVKLWQESQRLDWSCTCPMGEQGEFCKHAVATGLAWLAQGKDAGDRVPAELEAIRAYLENSNKQALVEMLLDCAADDDDLAAQLLLAAQRHGVSAPAAVRDAIRKAFAARDFIDYYAMPGVVAGARAIPEMLREILKQGDARTALELAANALARGLRLLEIGDDSDGMLGALLDEIAAIHLAAARKSGLAADKLAKQVFDLLLADGVGLLPAEKYLRALDRKGYAALRALAQSAWNKIPPLAPGDDRIASDDRRFQLAEIMKALAERDRDVDALVAVLARDLSVPYAFLGIAEALAKAGRHAEALAWAEKGRNAFPGRSDFALDDFLVAQYHRLKRHADAVTLRWSRFSELPSLHGYQQLHAAAKRSKDWEVWRERALDALRNPRPRKTGRREIFSYGVGTRLVLIEVLLWEGDPHGALAQARDGGCPGHLWLQIARALETDAPEDAVAIYVVQIEPIVRMTNNQAYDQAADLLRRIRDLMTRTGKRTDFDAYIDSLRIQHKAKRNFMQRLNSIATEKPRAASNG
jgi:uncharacterized Zn finger protein